VDQRESDTNEGEQRLAANVLAPIPQTIPLHGCAPVKNLRFATTQALNIRLAFQISEPAPSNRNESIPR
jgi:hypothetical protein